MDVWETYGPEARVWAIASTDDENTAREYAEWHGLTYPVLVDPGGVVNAQYDLTFAFPTGAYPQDFVVDPEGRIAYASNVPDIPAIVAVVAASLER